MSVRRTFHCDGPECDRHVETAKAHPPMFITAVEHLDADHHLHFCGWDCVLRYAGQRPTEEVIDA